MKNPKEMTDEELIRAEFMNRFSMWDIPTDKLDITLATLPNEVIQTHYKELGDILGKAAFNREIKDWLRRLSRTLSTGVHAGKTLNDIQRAGLQTTMLEVENFLRILKERSMLASGLKPLKNPSRSI